jgi:hypothetical protein
MLEIFSENPWLVAVGEVALVSLIGVVVGIVCISCNVCRRKIRLAQFDLELKRDMLQRGLSAEDIRTVIEARRSAIFDPAVCGQADWQPGTRGTRSVSH